MKQAKAVIFDLGGVLEYDSRTQVDSHAANAFGVSLKTIKKYLSPLTPRLQKGEIDEKQMWQVVSGKLNKPLPSSWKTLLREPHDRHFHILEETLQIVRELKRNGLKLGLLSNTQAAHARKEHQQRTFTYFDFVYLSHKHGFVKPDKRAYFTVVGKLKVKPSEAVYVDNVRKYVSAAKKIGMRGIWFRNAKQLRKALQKMKLIR